MSFWCHMYVMQVSCWYHVLPPHFLLIQETGCVRWSWSGPKPIFSSPQILQNGNVVFGVVDGSLHEVDPCGRKVCACVCLCV